MSNSVIHGLQHARLPCPSQSPRVCSNSCSLTQWCPPAISSSVVPFSSCLPSFPSSGSFPVSAWGFQFFHILTNTYNFIFFNISHPNGCELLLQYSFDLYFPGNLWCWVSFHVLIINLYTFFREWITEVLCPFLIGCGFVVKLWFFICSAY